MLTPIMCTQQQETSRYAWLGAASTVHLAPNTLQQWSCLKLPGLVHGLAAAAQGYQDTHGMSASCTRVFPLHSCQHAIVCHNLHLNALLLGHCSAAAGVHCI